MYEKSLILHQVCVMSTRLCGVGVCKHNNEFLLSALVHLQVSGPGKADGQCLNFGYILDMSSSAYLGLIFWSLVSAQCQGQD